ncbi:MAG: Negative regulator of genetic competence ClpC/MecB [Alphaproteobacteria bacterium ADurb.Bin438]|nr:MAG: Negative regulator of genetic competence ClpC/MecB [Alphaproteobacteria bacterium ADurb.Bin438]
MEKFANAIATSIVTADPTKPLMVASITGDRGVGKTETAKTVARSLGYQEHIIDMSEFTAESDANKLFGSTPGYIGYGKDTTFVKAARASNSMFIFKNLEKAHPSIIDKVTKSIQEGEVTTGGGEKIKITNSIVVFSSKENKSEFKEKNPMGFRPQEETTFKGKKFTKFSSGTIDASLPSTLSSLVDYKIEFAPHSEASLLKVVDKEVEKLSDVVIKQGIPGFSMTKSAKLDLINNVDGIKEKGASVIQQAFTQAVKSQVIKALPKSQKDKIIVVAGFDDKNMPVFKSKAPNKEITKEDVYNNILDSMSKAKQYASQKGSR